MIKSPGQFEAGKKIDWEKVDPKIAMSKDFSRIKNSIFKIDFCIFNRFGEKANLVAGKIDPF